MSHSSVNKAWEFKCVLESGKEIKSWFYSDTKEDATHRIKQWFVAKLISLKEIDDPLDIVNRQQALDKTREELAKKKHEEYAERTISKLSENRE